MAQRASVSLITGSLVVGGRVWPTSSFARTESKQGILPQRRLLRKVYLGISICVLVLLATASSALAAPVPCPTSGQGPNGAPSYADLLATNAGGGCFILDKVFSDFTFTATETGGAAIASASNLVYTIDSNTGTTGLIGFEFALALSAAGIRSNDVTLSYNVRTSSGAAEITSLHLLETGNASGGGTATVSETYCLGGLNNMGCSSSGTLNTTAANPHQDVFFAAVSQLSIIEDINVAGNGVGGSAAISGVRNAVDERP
jgi:hypothetical protein